MYGRNLINVFEQLNEIGLTESERSFGRWLGVGPDAVRDHRRSGGWSRVRPATVARLRARLAGLADRLPAGLAAEVRAVLVNVDQARAVAAALAR